MFPSRLRDALEAPPSFVAPSSLLSPGGAAPLWLGRGGAVALWLGRVWLAHGLPTHSVVPSVNRWCFQIGTEAFSTSIRSRHASNASARCGQATAATTARAPM